VITVYLAIAGVVAAGILCVLIAAARKRAHDPDIALLRRYQARLLAACAGDAAAVRRLIAGEQKRRPGISALEAVRYAHARLKNQRPHVWPHGGRR
jgi:hypothetical protein